MQEKPVYDDLMSRATDFMDSISSPDEKQRLQSQLDDIKKKFEDAKTKTDEELAREKALLDKTTDLDDKFDQLEKFVEDHETKLNTLAPVDCTKLPEQQKEVNVSLCCILFNLDKLN